MKNRAFVLAIIVGTLLSIFIPIENPTIVLAQTICYDARRQVIPCTPEPQPPRKKPTRTPVPPTKTSTPTPTFTSTTPPTMTPSVMPLASPSPTEVLVPEVNPGRDAALPMPTDFPAGFDQLFGLFVLIALLFLFWFIRKRDAILEFVLQRAPRIDYEISEDSNLLFREGEPKGSSMPLATEFDIPAADAHSKKSVYIEDHDPQREKPKSQGNLRLDVIAKAHGPTKPEDYFEEQHANRTSGLPPKKFPKMGNSSEDTVRHSDDDD
jgi:hypothetical protein